MRVLSVSLVTALYDECAGVRGTIKRKQLPIKLVLLDNQRLGMVRQWQELFLSNVIVKPF